MILKKSLKAFGTDDFRDELMMELEEHSNGLPTEHACDRGGYPNDISVYAVNDVVDRENAIYAKVSISFTEYLTGCSNVILEFPHDITCNVKIEKFDGEAEIELVEQEYQDEF